MEIRKRNKIRAAKAELRKKMLAQRKALSREEAERRSRVIEDKLRDLIEYKRADVIHCYVSAKWNEVDTHSLIEDSIRSGKRVVVPITDLKNKALRHSEIKSLDELEIATFGLLEPKKYCVRIVDLEEIDLVIVPGLAFDPYGGRIGFGGGFYDHFLSSLRAPKVALAYQFQVTDRIEMDDYDVRVDKIVTEEKIYEAKRWLRA